MNSLAWLNDSNVPVSSYAVPAGRIETFNCPFSRLYPRKFIEWGLYRDDILGYIQQESTFFKSKLYKSNPINPGLQLAGDYHLWKSFAASTKMVTINTVLASFRIHANQKSSNQNDYLAECDLKLSPIAKFLKRKTFLNKIIKLATVMVWLKNN